MKKLRNTGHLLGLNPIENAVSDLDKRQLIAIQQVLSQIISAVELDYLKPVKIQIDRTNRSAIDLLVRKLSYGQLHISDNTLVIDAPAHPDDYKSVKRINDAIEKNYVNPTTNTI